TRWPRDWSSDVCSSDLSLWALLVAYPTFTVPFCTWLLMGFFRSIPRDLEEAAMVDGATRLGAFRRVILPLTTPGILAAALFAFRSEERRVGNEGRSGGA